MISNALFVDLFKLIQPFAVFNRLRGYLVVSQARLNQLWAPPPMNLGELYAASLKTAALCLIYAPLWPPAYLITAGAMAFSFWCTKCAVSVWYRRPPMLSEELFQKMRSRLGLLMLLHTVVAAVGANAASSDAVRVGDLSDLGAAASSPVVAMFVLVALYELLDCPGCFNCVPGLRMFDQGSYAPTTLVDGEPIPYHDTTDADGAFRKGVEGAMGYEIDQYICPTARDNRAELTTDALISLVLRDFSFACPTAAAAAAPTTCVRSSSPTSARRRRATRTCTCVRPSTRASRRPCQPTRAPRRSRARMSSSAAAVLPMGRRRRRRQRQRRRKRPRRSWSRRRAADAVAAAMRRQRRRRRPRGRRRAMAARRRPRRRLSTPPRPPRRPRPCPLCIRPRRTVSPSRSRRAPTHRRPSRSLTRRQTAPRRRR